MTAVTLETLRSDFDEARYAYAVAYMVPNWFDRRAAEEAYDKIMDEPVDTFSDVIVHEDYTPELRKMVVAAHLYLMARNHGLQAAMLYKLSDGAMDPRGVQ